MNQTRNLTRHIKEIEDIYSKVINEAGTSHVYDNAAKDALGHSPTATEIQKDTGPENVENIEEPIKQESDSLKMRPKNINIGMNDKNVFDRLYSTIMEQGDEFDMGELEAGLDDGPEMGGEDELGGGEVTLTLSTDQADALRGLLSQLEEPAGDDIEDLDSMGGEEDGMEGGLEDSYREAVDAQHTGQGQHTGQDPTNLGPNKKNVVPGDASKTTSGGASGAVTDKVGNDGNLADSTAAMTSTSSGSQKVGGRVTGGNQNAFS